MEDRQPIDSSELRPALEDAMRQFGRQRANLCAARETFNKRLMQGSGTLILTCVLLGLGIWPIFCLGVGLMGTWWVVLAVGISDICDGFQVAAIGARDRLQRLLSYPDAADLYQTLFQEMEGFEYREWLKEYLPRPES